MDIYTQCLLRYICLHRAHVDEADATLRPLEQRAAMPSTHLLHFPATTTVLPTLAATMNHPISANTCRAHLEYHESLPE
jgi:hypothetical protein